MTPSAAESGKRIPKGAERQKDMNNIITKDMKIKEIEEVLHSHGVYMVSWWYIVLWGLLNDCDYLEIVGFGSNAGFVKKYNESGTPN